MSYLVVWPTVIRRRLLDFYAITSQGDGRETAELNAALATLESMLPVGPAQLGESRPGDQRIVFAPPLTVQFIVNPAERVVTIVYLHYYRRPES